MPNETDFFAGLTAPKPIRTLSLMISGSVSLIIPIFLYSIIWFERYGSDKKRTILNIVTSYGTWTGIEYLTIIQSAEIIRYMTGSMPASLCFFVRVFR